MESVAKQQTSPETERKKEENIMDDNQSKNSNVAANTEQPRQQAAEKPKPKFRQVAIKFTSPGTYFIIYISIQILVSQYKHINMAPICG